MWVRVCVVKGNAFLGFFLMRLCVSCVSVTFVTLCVRYVRYARLRVVSGLGVVSSVGWLFRGGFRRIQSELRAGFLCIEELRSLAVQCISFRPSVRNIVAQNGKTDQNLFGMQI